MSADRSDWRRLSAAALREGRSLQEAATAYRHANRHVRGNPDSGEMEHRRWRKTELGRLLQQGVPFHEARRRLEQRNPEPDSDELEDLGHSIAPSWSGESSGLRDRPWLVIAGVAAGAWLLWRGAGVRAQAQAADVARASTIQGGQPVQGQLETAMLYGHQTGSYQSSMDPTSSVPGGTMVNTTVEAPWDVGI